MWKKIQHLMIYGDFMENNPKTQKEIEMQNFLVREGLLGAAALLIPTGVSIITDERWYIGLILICLGLSSYVLRSYLKTKQ